MGSPADRGLFSSTAHRSPGLHDQMAGASRDAGWHRACPSSRSSFVNSQEFTRVRSDILPAAASVASVRTSRPAPPVARVPRIVAIGGGTGLPVVLRGLADAMGPVGDAHGGRSEEMLGAIVTVTDDGGSSGRLRRDLGRLPPGDIRNCLAALSCDTSFERRIDHRFAAGDAWLDGHAVGNLM